MKKLLILLLVVLSTLSGCAIVQEDKEEQQYTEPINETVMQELDLNPGITINPALYFFDKSKSELAAETRKISVGQNQRAEAQIVEAVLEGPTSENLQSVANGFVYEDIEILPNLINLFLTTDIEKSDTEISLMNLALASTLIDYSGVSYINIFVNGMQTGYDGHAIGVLQKLKGTLKEEEAEMKNASSTTPSLDVIMYFLNQTEQFLTPEARRIQFESNAPEEMVSTVVKGMIRGPENTYQNIPVIDKSIIELIDVQILEQENGEKIVRLNFNKAPVAMTEQFSDGEKIAAMAIAKTIIGFIPKINGVEFYVNGAAPAEQVVYTQEMSNGLLGNDIQLYFPNTTYTLLKQVKRMVGQETAGYPEELLVELMRGPTNADDREISPAFISGITMEDVNDVYLAGNLAVVDFNSSVQEKMKNVSEKDETMMIYAIVNTLTNLEGVKRVQFLLDGNRVESLGGGIINVIDPLLKNPGIIRNE